MDGLYNAVSRFGLFAPIKLDDPNKELIRGNNWAVTTFPSAGCSGNLHDDIWPLSSALEDTSFKEWTSHSEVNQMRFCKRLNRASHTKQHARIRTKKVSCPRKTVSDDTHNLALHVTYCFLIQGMGIVVPSKDKKYYSFSAGNNYICSRKLIAKGIALFE